MELALCPWNASSLFISENTPAYFLYSHGVAILAALVFGFVILYKNKTALNRVFFLVMALFVAWVLLDLMQWATNRPDFLLFMWSISIIVELLVYVESLHVIYLFTAKRDLSLGWKVAIFGLLLPILILLPTTKLLPGIYLDTCNAIESPFIVWYTYGVEFLIVLLSVIFTGIQLRQKTPRERSEAWLFVVGMVLFLVAFSSGNIIGSITDNWQLAQYGLFGMPVFIGILMYVITKFKSFQTKTLGAQLLVFSIGILVFSLFFAQSLSQTKIITTITFFLICIVGYLLIRSVKRETEQRERLQQLSLRLEKSNLDIADANEKLKGLDKLKTEFLSLASHQLRSPLTAIKGYASMLDEGSFGKLDEKQDQAVKRIYTSAQGLVSIVEDLLNVSKIEQGGMKYEMMPTELAPIIKNLFEEMKIPAESKGISFTMQSPRYDKFMANVDPTKIKQVFLNLADNSIKYTPQGGKVEISLSREGDNIIFAVKDNGVGISPETKAKLFEKFSRGEGGRLNTGGSGLGLYLAKQIAIAHKGDVIIESEGLGMGSTFKVILPAVGAHVTPNTMPS